MKIRFKDKETRKLFQGKPNKLPTEIQRMAAIKLVMLAGINNYNDLRVPPSNHLEKLHGDREGQFSIRINNKYRICFTVEKNKLDNVEITDYH
ncbi:type II toxin-antitoxin system RelE/ParE family toxin [Fructilactobacillus carniphilus]|uniref:Type II toxin-antitoxin system RelE/ParE family toxin n=1 Tax=Fructilactobacillus carniphilus TaxID=2940297 RepID=A0ABY5BZD5_9LACO|nr:type II toxin-antitoxin system RelE/ParE family toxin [Fructilactobacillus carniphilus]USS91298.1 type II toxin-antitoxin system RelE/ParE family toxin [Fructilactobacillus carniphilus]